MNFTMYKAACSILREHQQKEKLADRMPLLSALRFVDEAAASAAKGLSAGDRPLLATAVRLSPYLAVGYGAKRAYDSETGQRVRAAVQNWRYRRALRRQMGY